MKGKRVLAIMLIGVMAGSLCSCNSGEKAGTQNESETVTIFGGVPSRVSEPTTGLEKSDEEWYKLIEKKNDVKIMVDAPAASNLNERLQIMLSSGDYPDVILFQNHTDNVVKSAVESGIVIPITQYVNNAKNLQENIHENSWKCMKIMNNDEIYGIPRSTCVRADGYVVRKDWLDKVGLSIPENGEVTIDEFTEILKRFTENDPDGNGKNDTYGLAHSLNSDSEFLPAVSWPFDILGWQKHDGQYDYMDEEYCLEHDNYINCLEYNQMLYKNKYIDPDAPGIKSFGERFNQGITGVMPAFAASVATTQAALKKVNPDAELTFITGIKNADGEAKGTLYSTGYFWFYAITKAAKDPEKIVNMFNSMFDDDAYETAIYGVEGINYTKNENGKYDQMYNDDGTPVGVSAGRAFMRKAFDTEFFLQSKMNNESSPSYETMNKWLLQTMDNHVTSLDLGYKPEAAKEQKYMDNQKQMAQVQAKILVGEMDVSEYKKALNTWYDTLGREYVEQMNEYIKSTN